MSTFAPFSKPLYVMLKPIGSRCNLDCDYCYYLEKANLYTEKKNHVMSEELLEKLKQGASAKVKETLDAVYEVCREQQERGISDFSIATIAKLGAKRGVPKAQSIRNKSGDKYKALITAFADSSGKHKKSNIISKSDSDWIDEIPNPKHQLLAK